MAFDKVVDSQALDGALGAVADAIRGKTGSVATLTMEQMPGAISGIQTGGAELPELESPGSAGDLMEGKQLIGSDGHVVDGTFTLAPELAEQAALIDEIRVAVQSKTVGGAPEDLAAVIDEQAAAIAELKALLGSKASGGSGSGDAAKYVKFLATPESTASFTIVNPLGGIAEMVSVRRVSEALTEDMKILTYVASYATESGAVLSASAASTSRNAVTGVSSGLGNGEFMMTPGMIELRQQSSTRTWDTGSEYEVEIYQREEDAE